MNAELQLALELADVADVIAMASFRDRTLVVDSKPDMSLVSAADKAAEEALRAHLALVRPDDAVLGEEFGSSGEGAVRWILDPIDGTHGYVRGLPVWAALIAAEVEGRVTAGVVSAPALGRRWWAARGEGAFAGWHGRSEPIRVSGVERLDDAHLSSGWEEMLLDPRWHTLARRAWRTRGFGDFWSVMLVAEGAVDVAVEPGLLWDLAPLYVIVEEAGGRCSSLSGEPSLEAGHIVATNAHLHDEVLAALS